MRSMDDAAGNEDLHCVRLANIMIRRLCYVQLAMHFTSHLQLRNYNGEADSGLHLLGAAISTFCWSNL